MRRPVVVVGAGIIGLATAYTLLRQRPGLPLVVLEKEGRAGTHQTGHNSGVIHSGVYYRPGSLKAQLCRRGRDLLLEYLRSHDIPFRICGKVIVATQRSDLEPLAELGRRARANGVPDVRFLQAEELRQLEPEVAGATALHVPGTGIVDYAAVVRSLVAEVEAMGGEVRTHRGVEQVEIAPGGIRVTTGDETIEGGFLVNAAGLQADRVARLAGLVPPCIIVPFRGEHYTLSRRGGGLVHGLVYPVPDPDMPFLGVHLTPRLDGSVEAGPNAVLALAREGYRRTDLDGADLAGTLLYPGFARMAWRYWPASIREMLRSLSRGMFLDDLRRMVPALELGDLAGWGAGVRAQALGPRGELFDDFLLVEANRVLHVLNAPSPAATSSLAIAEHLVARIPSAVA
ncbi:MAG TPA: L-2-hydroxyglutarate oxidase [Thermoplasmata archaeon]|nr:L-2-hydroxyglutarate oxidase [Thermoplasmata archaeon]